MGVFKVRPSFDAERVGNRTVVRFSLPSLTGADTQVTGGTVVTVFSSTVAQESVVAAASRLVITVNTAFPAAWARHFEDELIEAELDSSGAQPEFTVTTSAGSATVTIFGDSATPASAFRDLVLVLDQADVRAFFKQ